MRISNRSTIHKRLKCFVDFIAPEKDKQEKLKQQADDIRDCIKRHATDDGFSVVAMPYSGSFAKKTGLRRHLQGSSEVEGQDIDIGFVLEDKDKNGNPLGCLVGDFEAYLKKCWPDSDVGKTKSSATITFKDSKNRFDAVPLIKTGRADIQKLVRTNGETRQSSVEKHKDFISTRTQQSNEIPGVVRFNDCVRLIKWWRYHQQSQSGIFGNEVDDEKAPSFLIDLLCAKAYDELSVSETYAETLARWFSFLAHIARNRKEVLFNDFIKTHSIRDEALWKVIDPMDDTNNVVKNWKNSKIDELTEWLEKARDHMARSIRYDSEGEDQSSLNCLKELFGNSIMNHCNNIQ